MKIRQIRNATIIVEFGGSRFLIDPWLAPKATYAGFDGTLNAHIRNPVVDLPIPVADLVDVDAVIVTHTHPDHWDDFARDAIPKDLPFFVQHFMDKEIICAAGFTNVRVLTGNPEFRGVKLIKTPGQHGSDECLQAAYDLLRDVCGVVFRHETERTLYLAGDTVWNQYVRGVLLTLQPDVIILNCGDAQVPGFGSIIMNKDDVAAVCKASPASRVIASHMEAVNHAMLTRTELRRFLEEAGLGEQVSIPRDGEILTFETV